MNGQPSWKKGPPPENDGFGTYLVWIEGLPKVDLIEGSPRFGYKLLSDDLSDCGDEFTIDMVACHAKVEVPFLCDCCCTYQTDDIRWHRDEIGQFRSCRCCRRYYEEMGHTTPIRYTED